MIASALNINATEQEINRMKGKTDSNNISIRTDIEFEGLSSTKIVGVQSKRVYEETTNKLRADRHLQDIVRSYQMLFWY